MFGSCTTTWCSWVTRLPDRVAAFARQWREAQRDAKRTTSRNTFVPLQFDPGEAFQFDWSEEYAVIIGSNTKLQVAQSNTIK